MSRRVHFIGTALLIIGVIVAWLWVRMNGDKTDATDAPTRDAAFFEAITREPSPYAIDVTDQALLNLGGNIYRQSCAVCHGVNFEGQANWRSRNAAGLLPAPPHDETGHTWHHPDEILFNLVKYGPGYNLEGYQSAMRGYEGLLTDEEIRAVNSFIAASWPDDVLLTQSGANARYETSKTQGN
ncbi:MAG: c-type cytochrome [Alphaproteobacteria bacterium]